MKAASSISGAARAAKGTRPLPFFDPMAPRFLEIRQMVRETADTMSLELHDPKSSGFHPGQFNMLYLFGGGEVAISISGDPAKPGKLMHTVRAVGSVTTPMDELRRGAFVGVRGPFGNGWPLEEAARGGRDVLILAGGIGLAPLRPLIYAIGRSRDRFGHVTLLYGARTPTDLLYKKELRDWQRRRIHVRTIVDHGNLSWRGRVGVLTDLLAEVNFDPTGTITMMCGPEVMMRFTQRELARRGMPPEDIHLSLERNMKCAVGFCGHCMLAGSFICKDGPIFRFSKVAPFIGVREL
jgi:NAD(P)H-flavin reductase